ncbi:hypothetical protein D3C77_335970 [compost metagenome]
MSSMNWPMARSRRASWPFSTAKREPDILAAASKSSRPRASPRSACSLAGPVVRGSPHFRTSTLSFSSAPSGTSAAARFFSPASRSRSSAPLAASTSAASAISVLRVSTSAFRRSASAMSFLPMAAPMALEAALRLARASWPRVWAARSSTSSARMRATTSAASSTPRDDQPATKASGLSRMARISCMASLFRRSREGEPKAVAPRAESGKP